MNNIFGVSDIIGRSITDNMNYLSMLVNQTRITDMATPLYKIGEEVILKSVNRPQFNGDYTIVAIVKQGDKYKCRYSGKTLNYLGIISYYGYVLDRICATSDRGIESIWAEQALRKKYPSSDYTFDELMNSLNLEMIK